MSSSIDDEAYAKALLHHKSGRLAEAAELYRQIIERRPNHSDALHLLGVLAHQGGKNDEAIYLIGRAIAENPGVGGGGGLSQQSGRCAACTAAV